jgi:streptogramin lyase
MQIHRTSNGKSPFGMALRENLEPGTGRLTTYWIDTSGAFIEDTVAVINQETPYDLVLHYVARNTQTGSWQLYGAEAGKPLSLLEQKENLRTILPDQSGSPTEPNFATIGLYPGEVAPGSEVRIGGFNVQATREAAETIAFNTGSRGPAATYVSQFTGSGLSRLSHPGGIARDEGGNLWVVDTNNNRVEKFDASGEWQKVGGTGSVGAGLLSNPDAVAIDAKGDVWVCDKGNSRIVEFDGEGKPLKVVGIPAGLREPEGMTLDPKGDVWVSDTYNHRLVEFDPEGNNPKVVGSGQIGEPEGITADPQGNVWVADWSLHAIEEFNEKGELIRKFLTPHEEGKPSRYPFALVRDSDGHVWEAGLGGAYNERVEKFSETGEFLGAFGPIGGNGPGQFNSEYPVGVATDGRNDVWVTDGSNSRVQRWMR